MRLGSIGRHRLRAHGGSILVEALVGLAVLVAVLLPLLSFIASTRNVLTFQREIAVGLAAGKLEEVVNAAKATWPPSPGGTDPPQQVSVYKFQVAWSIDPVGSSYSPDEQAAFRQATVTVTCLNCTAAFQPLRMVSLLVPS